MKAYYFSIFFSLIIWQVTVYAEDQAQAPCLKCSEDSAQPKLLKGLSDIKSALTSGNTHLVDSYFMVDTKLGSTDIDVVFKGAKDLGISSEGLVKANDLYSKFLTQPNLETALGTLKGSAGTLNSDEKLLVLSMIGSRLSSGYSSTTTENKNLNAIYLNAISGERNGGICVDIHRLLGETAKSLGFDNVGISTGLWQKDLTKNEAGGHGILHFRNPQTGEYYVQNYSQMINTKQKVLSSAEDVSSKILGVMSGFHLVESLPGKVHLYVPATAQWVKNEIQNVAQFKPDQAMFTIKAGMNEKTLAFQVGTPSMKAFALDSQVGQGAGAYRLEALGLAAKTEYSKKFDGRLIDEVQATVSAYGGGLQISAPGYDAMTQTFRQGDRQTFFGGGQIKGTARINNTTGKIEINASSYDISKDKAGKLIGSGSQLEMKAGAEQEWKPLGLKASAERVWQFLPDAIEQQTFKTGSMKTSYDRVGIVYDTRDPEKKGAYLVVGADIYFLEGANVSSAIALKNSIKAVLETERLGTFSVVADLGRVIQNKSGDPFYEQVPVSSIGIDWRKSLDKMTEIGFNLTQTKGNQITPFSVIGPITPTMGGPEKKVQGFLYIHRKF